MLFDFYVKQYGYIVKRLKKIENIVAFSEDSFNAHF